MSISKQLAFIRNGYAVNRYHQRHTAVRETVAAHSAGVAMFLILMNDNLPSSALLAAALVHDIPEGVTGDIPSPAKRAMGAAAKSELEKLEDDLLTDHRIYFDHALTPDESRQLKLADCFDGLMFCIEELRRGNRVMVDVGDRYLSYISESEKNPRESEIMNILARWWHKEKNYEQR